VVMGSDGGSGDVAGGGSAAARVATPSAYGPGPDMTTPDAFGAKPVVKANDLETPPQFASSLQGQGSASNYIALNVDDKHIIRAGAGTGDRGDGIFVDTTGKMINTIGTSLTTNVGGDETRTVTGDQTTTVSGGQNISVSGNQKINVSGTVLLDSQKTIDLKAVGAITITSLEKKEETKGKSYTNVFGEKLEIVTMDTKRFTHADSDTMTLGRLHSINITGSLAITVGASVRFQLATALSISGPLSVGINAGMRTTIIPGVDVKLVVGNDLKWVSGTDFNATGMTFSFNMLAGRVDTVKASKVVVKPEATATEASVRNLKADMDSMQAVLGNLKADVRNLIFHA